MFFAAVLNATLAGVEPEPLVDLTQASPRSPQTRVHLGMFGIGTPPLLARPNCFSAGSVTRLPAVVFAGIAVVGRCQLSLRACACHVVGDEVLRRGRHAVARRVLRDHEALDAEERARRCT